MKIKPTVKISIVALLIAIGVFSFYLKSEKEISPHVRVRNEVSQSALSTSSVWNQQFFVNHEIIKTKIDQLEKGNLCKNLKELDTKHLTHAEIKKQLNERNFKCIVRPMTVRPNANPLEYLKIDNKTTQNPLELGVAHQEICQDIAQPECVIRIKRDGFPLNRRSNPYSTKAVLLDEQGDPGSYDNEAFKIGWAGQALPKGPSQEFGLKKCPYGDQQKICDEWMDDIMEEVHPTLLEPMGTSTTY